MESDHGWGGGSDKWEIVDGIRTYQDWAHGLAFTGGKENWDGETCGERQATISFGEQEEFNKVIIWHHGSMHIPAVSNLQYWSGSNWVDISFQREVNTQNTWSAPETLTFDSVKGSKVKYSFNNCENTYFGQPMEHGWIYEFEVYTRPKPIGVDITVTGVPLVGKSTKNILAADFRNFIAGDPYDITITKISDNFEVFADSGTLIGGHKQTIPIDWTPKDTSDYLVVAKGDTIVASNKVTVIDMEVIAPVPELSTIILMSTGLLGLFGFIRLRRRN